MENFLIFCIIKKKFFICKKSCFVLKIPILEKYMVYFIITFESNNHIQNKINSDF